MEHIRRIRKAEEEFTRCWGRQLDMLVGVNKSVRSNTTSVVRVKVGVWMVDSSSNLITAVNKFWLTDP